MAHIKIQEIIEHLDYDMKRALESAAEEVFEDVDVDRSEFYRAFRRAVGRKCIEWVEVPDHLVRK